MKIHPSTRVLALATPALGAVISVSALTPASAATSPNEISMYSYGRTTVVQVKGGNGVENRFVLKDSGLGIHIRDNSGAPSTYVNGVCSVPAMPDTCHFKSVNDVVDVWGGDKNDTIEVNTTQAAILRGDEGDDRLRSLGTLKTTDYLGGPGNDTVDYTGVTAPVYASIDAAQNDRIGNAPAGYIAIDVENLIGGSGNDVLRGGPHGVLGSVRGGPGADTLYSGPEGSGLIGDAGNDRLVASSTGPNILRGGAGVDQLVGGSQLDWLFANDGASGDVITCGAGDDWVELDRGDTIRDPANCERIDYY